MFNFLIDKKSINLCVLSNLTKKIQSNELRASIWYHFLNIKEFNKELFEKENSKFNEDNKSNENKDQGNEEEIFYWSNN